jgi:glycosyltransferase involved in cell wall biosynthesis
MSPAPRLSVGLPVYNGKHYLPGSIEALLGQTYTDFELIISDNASTDGTAEICESYAKQDSRIRYIRQPRNIGLSPNHNFVVREARGEMFKWAAADDLYGRDLLRCCVGALDEHPGVVLAHSYTAAIDADGTVTHALDYPLATASPHAPERLRSFLFGSSGLFETNGPQGRRMIRVNNDGILRACDEYGVIRTSVLRKIAPLGSYHHSDRIVVVEVTASGATADEAIKALRESIAERLEAVADKLDLTAVQRNEIRGIHASFTNKFQTQRDQRTTLRQEELQALGAYLTPEQREKAKELAEEHASAL